MSYDEIYALRYAMLGENRFSTVTLLSKNLSKETGELRLTVGKC